MVKVLNKHPLTSWLKGWLIICIPLLIIISLSLLHGLPWVEEQCSKGALGEAADYVNLGRALMRERRNFDAELQFQEAIRIKPDYAEAYVNMGIIEHLRSNNQKALWYFNKAIALNPKKKEIINNNLGIIYTELKDYDRAIEEFHEAAGLGIRNAKIWRNIAEAEMGRDSLECAIRAFQEAIRSRDTIENLYVGMLREAIEEEGYEEYYNDINKLLTMEIADEVLRAYDRTVVDQCLRHDRILADDYINLGLAYEKTNNLDQAIVQFTYAWKMQPDRISLLNRIGLLNAKLGYFYEAEQAFRKVLQVEPDNAGARKALMRLTQPG